ncbi:MAG: hypothetical protein JSV05_01980 [Candidatus Bathyarchaeota archaeon]|nr:MAG: hypothetical protein JSV05_01980 [Candidatus Bathyarchaeota archaeon]
MAIKRISVKDEGALQKIVSGDIAVVEKGLTTICSNMPIDAEISIDVLCHDESGQLVIVKLSIKENDNMFFEGLKILTHVNNVKPMLKFTYKDFKISDAKTPRLIFLAPSYSTQLVDVVGQMQGIQMDLYTWEYFEFDDKNALHLEPTWLSEETRSKPSRPKPIKPRPPKTFEQKPEEEHEKELDPITEVVMPPREVESKSSKKDEKERAKKKSIFSI